MPITLPDLVQPATGAVVTQELQGAVVGAADGNIKQAPALAGNDPAGGNIARGTVIAVNSTSDCTLVLN